MIMLWYGEEATVPSGWHICDGTVGTPDLRSKFVRCAGSGISVGQLGGCLSHKHLFTGDGHAHDLTTGTEIANVDPAGDYSHASSVDPCSGETGYGSHTPPYHALYYIMKL